MTRFFVRHPVTTWMLFSVFVVLAVVVARIGSFALSVEGQSIPITAGPTLIATGVAICIALGVLAGLVPAWQASRREIAACFRTV